MPLNLNGYANGTALPEDERTRVVADAAANGYSAELGLPDGGASPEAAAGPGATSPSPLGPAAGAQPITKNEPLIDFKKNPMAAIGHVLSSMAAGAQGQPLPGVALREQRAQEQQAQQQAEMQAQARRMQGVSLALSIVEQGTRIVAGQPEQNREAVIDHFASMYADIPGMENVGDLIRAGVSGKIQNAATIIPMLRELGSAPLAEKYAQLAMTNPDAANQFGASLLAAFATKTGSAPKPGETQAQARERAAGEREGAPPKTPQQLGEEAEAIAAGSARGKASVDGPDDTKMVSVEGQQRGEFSRASKTFVEVRDAFQRVRAAANRKTGAGAISLVFGFMKMLDPTSTVREGEAATVEQARGVPTGLLNLYNRLIAGDTLPDEQRSDILNTAKSLYADASKNQKKLVGEYEGLASRSGARAENVIIDYFDESLEDTPFKIEEVR